MSGIAQIVDTLEARLSALFLKLDTLEKTSGQLKEELQQAATTISRQKQEIESLKSRHDALKMANSLLGSDENKRDTKLKINSLIREIDYCIAQLSD